MATGIEEGAFRRGATSCRAAAADVRETVEQLAAGQDHLVREINQVQAADDEILAKIPVPPPRHPTPARKPTPIAPPPSSRGHATYFEWLFEQPVLNAQPKLVSAVSARLHAGQRFRWARGGRPQSIKLATSDRITIVVENTA